MALAPRLDLRQTQTLIITPQLQQAIKLLQLSNIELATYIDEQIEKNPLLEREEQGGSDDAAGVTEMDDRSAAADADDSFKSVDLALNDGTSHALDQAYDFEGDEVNEGAPRPGSDEAAFQSEGEHNYGISGRADYGDSASHYADDGLTKATSLREHLKEQLAIDFDDPVEKIIGLYLIETLDESGYVTTSTAELATRLGCDEGRVVAALSKLQQFDPPGIFARDLSECLALQLRDRNRLDETMQQLLRHLDLVALGQLDALAKVCQVNTQTVREMIREIRNLNPKPALVFDEPVTQPVTPDVIMRAHPAGGWLIELNVESLPRLLVNNQYYSRLFKGNMKKHERQYLSHCLQTANWLVKALHQRATTILKVSTEIVRQQEEFFSKGVVFLKPLVLRDIANAVELHESTVSRVTSNKYISTPRGIFELKYFFSQAVGGAHHGDVVSAEAVRYRIRALIDGEASDRILSDDAIVDILRKEGIEIARRTVAKYREAMGVPSSVRRRRQRMARI